MRKLFLIIFISASFSAAAGDNSPNLYKQGMQSQEVISGTVVNVRSVTVKDGSATGQYAAVGAGTVVGAALGSQAGKSTSANAAGAAIGGLVGGVVGNTIQDSLSKQRGSEIIVKTDEGTVLAIAQESDIKLQPGQKVYLITGASGVRVVSQ